MLSLGARASVGARRKVKTTLIYGVVGDTKFETGDVREGRWRTFPLLSLSLLCRNSQRCKANAARSHGSFSGIFPLSVGVLGRMALKRFPFN